MVKYRKEALFDGDLSEVNQPFYFPEFMSEAHRDGLQLLGDSSLNGINPDRVTGEVRSKLKELEGSEEVVREQ